MSLLQAYLQNPRTRMVLKRKPGEKGFSLIELVVVVAVLAILAAIAIPAFTSITGKARASAAANTVATVAKECAAKIADQGVGSSSQYNVPSLDSYKQWGQAASIALAKAAGGAQTGLINCPSTGVIGAVSSDETEYPSFYYNVSTGEKDCVASSTPATDRGCDATSQKW